MQVIVVGAGPAGLLLALLLARKGVSVHVVEAAFGIDDRPRATHYGPPAVYELNRAGIAGEARKAGFTPRTVCWRKLDGTFLGGLDGSILDGDPDRLICLPLEKLGQILENHLKAQPSATISFQHKVVSIGQDEHKAWINAETPEGLRTLAADYIVGCDGASSRIRRSLFGDMNFPGRTWDEQIVATNVCPGLSCL
jgi:2-polyprenyl-6-methoxyphenol hydroxylase-like FAD-dependent oxidoreductase